MKRILSVFVVIIAVFSLTSCGSDNGSGKHDVGDHRIYYRQHHRKGTER